ncbi:MAG: nicotinamide mononucleotide transporter [Bifidobacterium dentium]
MFTWWQGILAVITTIVIYLIVVFVSSHTGGVQVRLDGTLLPLGIVGQILMTYGYRSQWVAWIILDVIKVVILVQPAFRRRSWRHVMFFWWSCWPTVFTRMGLVPQEQHYDRMMICNQVFARKA